jgi:hypothetical protein
MWVSLAVDNKSTLKENEYCTCVVNVRRIISIAYIGLGMQFKLVLAADTTWEL